MTTIAYKNGVLVADSQATSSDRIEGRVSKIIRVGGIVASAAGEGAACTRFLEWVKKGCPPEKPDLGVKDEDAAGYVWMPDGRFVRFGIEGMTTKTAPFYSYGSGSDFAIGAMLHGASALEALRIAGCMDIYTSGPFLVATHIAGPEWVI